MGFKEDYENAKAIVKANKFWEDNWKSKTDFMNDTFPNQTATSVTWNNRIKKANEFLEDVENSLFKTQYKTDGNLPVGSEEDDGNDHGKE